MTVQPERGGGDEAEALLCAVRDTRPLPAGAHQAAGDIHGPRHTAGDSRQGPTPQEQRHQVNIITIHSV